jgi:hypothetical protein
VKKQNWCSQIQELIKEFPNVYTDISHAEANQKTHKAILADIVGR